MAHLHSGATTFAQTHCFSGEVLQNYMIHAACQAVDTPAAINISAKATHFPTRIIELEMSVVSECGTATDDHCCQLGAVDARPLVA